jgi:uncharacterized membrane protein
MRQGEPDLTRQRTTAVVVVALLAVLLGLVLRWETAGHQISGIASSCTLSPRIDCDKVQASRYSDVLGVPLSLWGAGGNLVLLAWVLASRRLGESGRGLLGAAALLAAFGLLVSLYLLYVSLFEIGAVCLYCSGIQLCSLVLAILLVPAAVRAGRPRLEGRAAGVAVLLALLFLVLTILGDAHADRIVDLKSLARQEGTVQMRLDISGAAAIGEREAEHTVIMFLDFGCPVCKDCYGYAKDRVDREPGNWRFIFKHFPLDRTCNREADSTTHPGACDAANAAAAATGRGRPRQAFDFLFAQDAFFPQVLDKLAKKIGLADLDAWRRLRASDRAKDLVARDVAEGKELRLDRVPIAYLDGRPIDPTKLRTK